MWNEVFQIGDDCAANVRSKSDGVVGYLVGILIVSVVGDILVCIVSYAFQYPKLTIWNELVLEL